MPCSGLPCSSKEIVLSMALDSSATFQARCNELAMDQKVFQELQAGGITTFANLAFCVPQQPSGINDGELMRHLESLLSTPPDPACITLFRRLAFEAHALALQNLKSRLERTTDTEPKILPLQEKMVRTQRQQSRLAGIVFTPHNSPAHSLIDKASQQVDDGVLQHIPLGKCGSRYSESLAEKSHASIRFSADGHIKVDKKAPEPECDVSTAHLLRCAMSRRSLAYDLAGAASYEALTRWPCRRLQVSQPRASAIVSSRQGSVDGKFRPQPSSAC